MAHGASYWYKIFSTQISLELLYIRKTPLHVPDMGAHIRQGLSHMLDVPTIPEGVTCSPVSGTT